MKTKRLSIKYQHLVQGKFPNAGPHPSIKGMKEQFYGKDSICVMCGNFLYHIGDDLNNPNTSLIYSLAK